MGPVAGAVHELGEPSIEAAQSPKRRFVLGNLGAEVLLAKSRAHHLDERGEMERIVQRAIPSPTQCRQALLAWVCPKSLLG